MRLAAIQHRVRSSLGGLIERLAEVSVLTSGVVLAAQAFLALTPLLLAVIAFAPPDLAGVLTGQMRARFGLSGSTDALVVDLTTRRENLRSTVSAISAVVVLVSATAFTRALQRVYEGAWGLPRVGLRGSVRGLVWLAGLVAYLSLLGLGLRLAGGGVPGTLIRGTLLTIGALLLWWWTPYLLLLGRVRARAVLPTGALTAAATLTLGAVSNVVVPRMVRSNEHQYGTLGTVFAIESWLVVVGCTIVLTAVLGAWLADQPGPLGRLIRGADDPAAWLRPPRRSARSSDGDGNGR
jgi:membrane protein